MVSKYVCHKNVTEENSQIWTNELHLDHTDISSSEIRLIHLVPMKSSVYTNTCRRELALQTGFLIPCLSQSHKNSTGVYVLIIFALSFALTVLCRTGVFILTITTLDLWVELFAFLCLVLRGLLSITFSKFSLFSANVLR